MLNESTRISKQDQARFYFYSHIYCELTSNARVFSFKSLIKIRTYKKTKQINQASFRKNINNMRNPALSLLNRLHTTSTSTTARIRFLRPAVVRKEISPTKILFSQYYHQGSAPTSPFSIDKLREMIHASSSSASYYPSQLVSLIDESADQERQSNLSDEMYNKVTHEMMSFMLNVTNSPNGLVEDEDRMGGEGVYNPEVLDMCKCIILGQITPFFAICKLYIHQLIPSIIL